MRKAHKSAFESLLVEKQIEIHYCPNFNHFQSPNCKSWLGREKEKKPK